MTRHLLVTGAPGNVGSEVVYQLLAGGHEVRVTAFDTALARAAFGDSIEIVHFAEPAGNILLLLERHGDVEG